MPWARALGDGARARPAKRLEPPIELRVGERQDGGREQRRVDGAGLADGERADRHAARHLHDGVEAVEARERLRFHRHAEHGQRRQRSGHARQMRGAARPGDDDLEASALRRSREFVKALGRAVRGDDASLIGDRELVQRLGGSGASFPSRTGCP